MSARYRAAKSVARDRKEPRWSAERRASPIARGGRTRKRAGRLRQPLTGSRKPRRLPALRFPFLGTL